MAGVLSAGGVISRLLEAGGEAKARSVNQVIQVAVVGTIIENSIPSLRCGESLYMGEGGERERDEERERERERERGGEEGERGREGERERERERGGGGERESLNLLTQ